MGPAIFEEEIKLLKETEPDAQYVYSHFEQLRKEYSGQYIAVKNLKVVACNPSLDLLLKSLEELKIDDTRAIIEYIPDKDFALIV